MNKQLGMTRQGVPDLGQRGNKHYRNKDNEQLLKPQRFGDELDIWEVMFPDKDARRRYQQG